MIEKQMHAVRLHALGDPAALSYERVSVPRPGPGEVLVRVHAGAITRDELTWPEDRLPATPSYELSGVIAATGPGQRTPRSETRSTGSPPSIATGPPPTTSQRPKRSSHRNRARSTTSRARRSLSPGSAPGRACSTTAS
jgi:threonine dehydrogenase-like Zn-dependent dehydrogenase